MQSFPLSPLFPVLSLATAYPLRSISHPGYNKQNQILENRRATSSLPLLSAIAVARSQSQRVFFMFLMCFVGATFCCLLRRLLPLLLLPLVLLLPQQLELVAAANKITVKKQNLMRRQTTTKPRHKTSKALKEQETPEENEQYTVKAEGK